MKFIVIVFLLLFFYLPFAFAVAPSLDAIPTPQNLTEGVEYTYDVNATDPEDGPLYFSDDSGYFDIDENTGIFSFSPTEAMIGSFIAVIIVRDNESLIDAQAIEFVVNGLPDIDAISNQAVNASSIFYYDVNATDSEDGSNVTYYDNSSLFIINSSTGEINFTTNSTVVGTYSINISVQDTEGASSAETFELVINDFPNMTIIPNSSTTEDVLFELNISQYVNNSVGSLTYYDNSSLFNINSSTGIISFTPILSQVGYYSINLSVNDSYGGSDSQNWYLNISQTNDPPTFTNISNQTAYVGSNFTLTVSATDEENNTIFYYDNSSLFVIGESTGLINFYVNSSMIENYNINISVNDSLGAEYSSVFNLNVIENAPPSFPRNITKSISPNFDSYVDSQYNTTSYQGSEYLYLSDITGAIKRSYLNFSLSVIPSIANLVESSLNLTINSASAGIDVSIFQVNSSLNSVNLTNANQPNISVALDNVSSVNAEESDSFNISNLVKSWFNGSSLNYGVSVRMQNENSNSNSIKYYSSNSPNSTKWPSLYVTYNSYIENQTLTVSNNLSDVFDLDDYFYDTGGANLTYNFSATSYSTITIDENNVVSIVGGSSAGTDNVIFSATDGINTTNSNTVQIVLSAVASTTTTTTTSSGGGGGGGSSRRTASLSILFDSDRWAIEEGAVIQLPVKLKNTGEVKIENILLDLESDVSGLDLKLSETVVTSLAVDEYYNIIVIIDSTGASAGSYVVSLNANTDHPTLSESAVFVLDIGGLGEALEKNLVMVQDLFQNNPECMELQELITRAENQLELQQYEKARINIDLAIEGCKNMVRIQNDPFGLKENYSPLVRALLIFGGLTLLIVGSYSLFMKFKFFGKKRK